MLFSFMDRPKLPSQDIKPKIASQRPPNAPALAPIKIATITLLCTVVLVDASAAAPLTEAFLLKNGVPVYAAGKECGGARIWESSSLE
jgi:hypothetical protein